MAPRLCAVLCLVALLYNVANYVCATVQMTEFQITTRSLCPGYTLLEIDAISTGHCAIKCHRNAAQPNLKCIGFCYNYSTMKCRLYKKNLADGSHDSKWINIRYAALDRTHSKALSLCAGRNQWLVIPQTDEEIAKIGGYSGKDFYHVALNSLHQHANFTTANGKKPQHYFWRGSQNQPSYVSTRDCVAGYYKYGWYDKACGSLYRVFCQTPEPVTCMEGELMEQLPNATYDTSEEPCYKLK